jgi:hypothetical protein
MKTTVVNELKLKLTLNVNKRPSKRRLIAPNLKAANATVAWFEQIITELISSLVDYLDAVKEGSIMTK